MSSGMYSSDSSSRGSPPPLFPPVEEPTPQFKGHDQPKPSVRLKQIVSFLGDEDSYRKLYFITYLAEIEEYLKDIEPVITSLGSPELSQLYNDATVMVDVHKHLLRKKAKEITAKLRAEMQDSTGRRDWRKAEIAWIEKIQSEKIDMSLFDSNIPRPMKIRTAERNAKSERRLKIHGKIHRSDRPPFTLVRESDHDEFCKMFRDKIDGISLKENKSFAQIEEESYAETLLRPRTLEDHRESQLSGTEGNFEARAKLRGARRAGIEMLLNMIGDNKEQARFGDRFRSLELPTWTPPPKEISLAMALPLTQRPLELNTFFSTTAMMRARRAMQRDYRASLMANLIEFDRNFQMPVPKDFASPQVFLEGDELKYTYQDIEIEKAALREQFLALFRDIQTFEPKRTIIYLLANHIQIGINGKQRLPTIQAGGTIQIPPCKLRATLRKLLVPTRSAGAHLVLRDDWKPSQNPPSCKTIDFVKTLMQLEDNLAMHLNDEGTRIDVVVKMVVDQKLVEQTTKKDKQEMPDAADTFVTIEAAQEMLRFMHSEGLIEITEDNDDFRVWRTRPVDAEDMYVIGERDSLPGSYGFGVISLAQEFPDVDFSGITTPAIFFNILAYQLGRLIRGTVLGYQDGQPVYPTPADRINYHFLQTYLAKKSMAESCELTKLDRNPLRAHAKELNSYVYSLASEANLPNFCPMGSSEQDCAKIVQMEILEELNSNYDHIYPEREQVWNFAASRLGEARQPDFTIPDNSTLDVYRVAIDSREKYIKNLLGFRDRHPEKWTRKYHDKITRLENEMMDFEDAAGIKKPVKRFFDIRFWPVESQADDIQKSVRRSGPIVQGRLMDPEVPTATAPGDDTNPFHGQQPMTVHRGPPREQHFGRGQYPMMPFGETKYQQAYLSFRMSDDLRDVPQFMDRDKHGNLINIAGYLVDENMDLINEKGKHVDLDGKLVTKPMKAPELRPDAVVPPMAVRRPKPVRGPFALPRLSSKWRPESITRRDLENKVVNGIHMNRHLVAEVGPDSVPFDDRVMSEQAIAQLKSLEAHRAPTTAAGAKRAAQEALESMKNKKRKPEEKKAERDEVLGYLQERKNAPPLDLPKDQKTKSDEKAAVDSSKTKDLTPDEKLAAEHKARIEAFYAETYRVLGPTPQNANGKGNAKIDDKKDSDESKKTDEPVEEEDDSDGASKITHKNEKIKVTRDGKLTRQYMYKGKLRIVPYPPPPDPETQKLIDKVFHGKHAEALDDVFTRLTEKGSGKEYEARKKETQTKLEKIAKEYGYDLNASLEENMKAQALREKNSSAAPPPPNPPEDEKEKDPPLKKPSLTGPRLPSPPPQSPTRRGRSARRNPQTVVPPEDDPPLLMPFEFLNDPGTGQRNTSTSTMTETETERRAREARERTLQQTFGGQLRRFPRTPRSIPRRSERGGRGREDLEKEN